MVGWIGGVGWFGVGYDLKVSSLIKVFWIRVVDVEEKVRFRCKIDEIENFRVYFGDKYKFVVYRWDI